MIAIFSSFLLLAIASNPHSGLSQKEVEEALMAEQLYQAFRAEPVQRLIDTKATRSLTEVLAKETKPDSRVINLTSTAEFFAFTAQTEIPVIIDYSASWCGPCRELESQLNLLSLNFKEFAFSKVICDKEGAEVFEAKSEEIEAFPTIDFYYGGVLSGTVRGADLEKILQILSDFEAKSVAKKATEKKSKEKEVLEQIKLSPEIPEIQKLSLSKTTAESAKVQTFAETEKLSVETGTAPAIVETKTISTSEAKSSSKPAIAEVTNEAQYKELKLKGKVIFYLYSSQEFYGRTKKPIFHRKFTDAAIKDVSLYAVDVIKCSDCFKGVTEFPTLLLNSNGVLMKKMIKPMTSDFLKAAKEL